MKEQNIYDNDTFFTKYLELRKDKKVSTNELIEMPQLFNLIGDVKGLEILDLGCGMGEHDVMFTEMGAKSVLGIDLSKNMIDKANNENKRDNITYEIMSMSEIEKIDKKFDLVVSSLALHYVEDYDMLCKKVYDLLNDGGRFIFSCSHPMDSAVIFNKNRENFVILDGKKYFLLSDYNNEGIRCGEWFVKDVVTYHRNVSSLTNGLINAGFKLERMEESFASEEAIKAKPKLKEQKDHSYYIYFKALK